MLDLDCWSKEQLENDIAELEHLLRRAEAEGSDADTLIARRMFRTQLAERRELLASFSSPHP